MLLLEDKLKKVFDNLKFYDTFVIDSDQGYSPDAEDLEFRLQTKVDKAIHIANGVSKAAIIIPDCSYVLKIPFNGDEYDDNWDDELEEYKDKVFRSFEYANDLNIEDASCWDYCENELIKYENAVDAGFGPLFAETRYYGSVDGHPIYIQEKVTGYNDYKQNKRASDKSTATIRNGKLRYVHVNSNWLGIVMDKYGEEMTNRFVEYLEDTGIMDDLHEGNIGFNAAGDPVILDLAGWRD